jgi:molybdopterin-guanine dinucleotide biosynthesis adapter protein
MPPVLAIVGKSDSGKTTLLETLIPELKKRGYRIGTVKHAFHGTQMDSAGKDSWRHKRAGAETVVVAYPGGLTLIKDQENNALDDIVHYFGNMDIVLAEGYKHADVPKIEVFRAVKHQSPVCPADHNLIALVTDDEIPTHVPKFGFKEIEAIADLLEKKFL